VNQRLLIVSPVRNEGAHLERVVRAVAAQRRRPDAWVVVDDGSTDDTRSVLEQLASRYEFMTVLDAPAGVPDGARDRLAAAAAPRAFNFGLRSVDWQGFTHIAKLDGDTELPSDYFELLLANFARRPRLGLAGGVRRELVNGREALERVPTRHHVPGALKCYTLECFRAIGGMHERLGWDTIDEVYARMRGFETQTFTELVAIHHRPWGSADGQLRGRARHGRCAYIVHYPLPWALLRAVKTAGSRPQGLSGLAYLIGYLAAAAGRVQRVEDREFRAFFRRELRERAWGAVAEARSRALTMRSLAESEG
jgi:biofilm PGA synthesis N-glycosyltransferase PgaC